MGLGEGHLGSIVEILAIVGKNDDLRYTAGFTAVTHVDDIVSINYSLPTSDLCALKPWSKPYDGAMPLAFGGNKKL